LDKINYTIKIIVLNSIEKNKAKKDPRLKNRGLF